MRHIFCILLIALAMGCQSRPTTVQTGTALEISDATLDKGTSDTIRFGRLHAGETGVKQFRLRNTSSRTLVITRYEVSCQCVKPEFERRPLKSGEEIPLSVRFDTRGESGWQMKLLKFYTSESNEPLRVYVEADVL